MRILIALILLAGTVAHADDTFETKAAGATRITALEDLVWGVVASCESPDDVEARQCRHLRDAKLAGLVGKTLALDVGAFTVAEWSPARKSAEITLSGCIACDGVFVDGKRYSVVATVPRVDAGKVDAKPIVSTAKPFDTNAARGKYDALAKRARVELVVKLADKPKWEQAGKAGVALEVIAYRVSVPCDGLVLLASPPSAKGPVDAKTCPKP
jgi:hypothetical protein